MKNVQAVIGRNLTPKMRDALLMLRSGNKRGIPLPTARALLARGYVSGWDQTQYGHELTEEGRKVADALFEQQRADVVRALEGERPIDERFADIVAGLSLPDLRLFRELVVITDHPEMWVQQRWSTVTNAVQHILPPSQRPNVCGTAACLAGSLLVSAGVVSWRKRGGDWAEVFNVGRARELGIRAGAVTRNSVDWPAAASDLIGKPLERDQYGEVNDGGPDELFAAHNTLANLWQIAETLTEGRVRLPADLEDRVRRIDEDREEWIRRP